MLGDSMSPAARRKSAKRLESNFKRYALKLRVSSAFKRIPSAQSRPRTSYPSNTIVGTTSIGVEAHMRRAAVSGRLLKAESSLSIVRAEQHTGTLSNLSYMVAGRETDGLNQRIRSSKCFSRLTIEGEKLSKANLVEMRFTEKKTLLAARMRKGESYGESVQRPPNDSLGGREKHILETYNKDDLDDLVDWEDTSSTLSGISNDEDSSSLAQRGEDVENNVDSINQDKGDDLMAVEVPEILDKPKIPSARIVTSASAGKNRVTELIMSVKQVDDTPELDPYLLTRESQAVNVTWVSDSLSNAMKPEEGEPCKYVEPAVVAENSPKQLRRVQPLLFGMDSFKDLKTSKISAAASLTYKPLTTKSPELERKADLLFNWIPSPNMEKASTPLTLLRKETSRSDLPPAVKTMPATPKRSSINNRSVSINTIQLPNIHAKPPLILPRVKPFAVPEDTSFSAFRDSFTPGKPLPKPFHIAPSKLSVVQPRHHPKLFMTLRPLSGVQREMVTFAGKDAESSVAKNGVEEAIVEQVLTVTKLTLKQLEHSESSSNSERFPENLPERLLDITKRLPSSMEVAPVETVSAVFSPTPWR
ncbi:hypothetical protein BC829DRAFT_394701 [Chytridium lagenaria]|nr:hypothetical protein BC829DRAFT_394701 [Chytridium lagenaria]